MLMRLVRLELTKLLPWVYALVALHLLTLLWALSYPPNQSVWVTSMPLFREQNAGIGICLTAMLLSYSGFARDSDDGTLAFVFGLPVPRAQIFLAKVMAPGLVGSGDVLVSELLRWGQQLSNPTSFGGQTFRADWQGWAIVLSLLLVWIVVAYCQLLTVFRRFGLLLIFSLYTTINSVEGQLPWLRKLAPWSILHVEFAGQRALVQWSTIGAHALGALLACCLAALVWVGPMDQMVGAFARWARRPLLAWSAGLIGAGLAIAAVRQKKDMGGSQVKSSAPQSYAVQASSALGSALLTRQTRHYELHYPETLAGRIEPLAAVADEIYERLAERLGVVPGEQIVLVDFTRRSPTHAGSATLNTIRMDPFASPTFEALERTFAHETAHVVSLLASDRRLSSEGDAVGFFSEGLAEAMALELRPSAQAVLALQLEAALARQRLQPTFAQLIRYQDFTLRHGPFLAYAIGFTWTRALLASCGQEAPGRVLQALGSPDAPLTLVPEGLWQHLLQRAGCDILRVNTAWENQLIAIAAELKPEIDRVPEFVGGTPRWVGEEVRLQARVEGTPLDGSVLSLLVRSKTTGSERSGVAFLATPGPSGELEFHVPSRMVVDGSLQFQFSLRFYLQGSPVCIAQEWTKSLVAR